MTNHDAAAYPGEPERIGDLFGEVFDLVDEVIDGITDNEVDDALRGVLAADPRLGGAFGLGAGVRSAVSDSIAISAPAGRSEPEWISPSCGP